MILPKKNPTVSDTATVTSPIKHVDTTLVNANPQLYAASLAGDWSLEEKAIQSNLIRLVAKDQELTKSHDMTNARKTFFNLDPSIQAGLQFINPDAEYQKRDPSIAAKLGSEFVGALTDPFRKVTEVAGDLIKAESLQYKIGANLQGKNLKEGFNYLLSKKTWEDAWNGHNQWTEESKQILEKKHGTAMSILARNIADGKKPGDVIREYGPLDSDMIRAITGMANQTSEWKLAYQDHKDYQINLGNDITNWANTNHPPSDNDIWSNAIIPVILTLPTLGGGDVTATPDGKKWLVDNPLPWEENRFRSPSGQFNAVYVIAHDPITWLTAGSSKAILPAEKIAEDFTKAAQAGVSVNTRVTDIFRIPAFANEHTRLVEVINELRSARQLSVAGNKTIDAETSVVRDTASALLRMRITREFPKYDDDELINRLVNVKVLDDQEKSVYVTDLNTLQKFFEIGENTNYIISGRVNGGQYYRENHVMLERRTRKLTNATKELYDQVFNGIDRKVLTGENPIPSDVLETAAEFEKYVQTKPSFDIVDPKTDSTLTKLKVNERNFTKLYNNLMSKHGENAIIYHQNGYVEKSLNIFRDFTRLITGDKLAANTLTERFLRVSPDERLAMLLSLYKLYTDKIGMAASPQGVNAQRELIEGIFAPTKGMGPVPDFQIPEHMVNVKAIDIPSGSSQVIHNAEGVAVPNFVAIHSMLYSTEGLHNGLQRYLTIGGLTNNAVVNGINKGWSLATLFPKLGPKSAVDEGTIGVMVQAPQALYSFFSGKGNAMSKGVAAMTGSDKSMGLVKSFLYRKTGVNPVDYVPALERKAMQEPVEVDVSFRLPNGKEVQQFLRVPADIYWGGTFEERLAARIVTKYGNKLTDEEKGYFFTYLINNSHAMEGLVRSTVGATFGDTKMIGKIQEEMYGKSTLTEAMDSWGRKDLGVYITDEHNALTKADRVQEHFSSFYKYFGKNIYKTTNGNVVDFGGLFVTHNGLRTAQDTNNYVADIMNLIGFSVDRYGNWVIKQKVINLPNGKTKVLSKETLIKSTKAYVEKFLQTKFLRDTGKTDAEIAEGLVRKSASELYTIFHGSHETGIFNQRLLDTINDSIKNTKDQISKNKNWEASNAHLRNYAKAPSISRGPEEIAKRQANNLNRLNPSFHVRKMPFEEFEAATKNNPLMGTIKTSMDFPTLPITVEGMFQKFQNIAWEMMDRQLTDIYRSDVFHIKILQQRKIMLADQKVYEKGLIKDGVLPADARQQAEIYFDNRATDNAAAELLKYADNPEVRTQLAWNLRGVGRFYRATEDYVRRLTRYLYTHPDKVMYRLGHIGQAMSGSGLVYTDENGNKYVLFPNDGVLVTQVAPILTAITTPVASVNALINGDWSFFKKPEWNQSTLKISIMNPSYSEGAGVPSLSGPTAAVSIFGVKAFLNTFNNPTATNIGENLDNWILGPQSDNTTWVRALVPTSLLNFWKTLPTDHKEGQEATNFIQAAAYLQSNSKTKMTHADWGDAAKVQQYYDRLRLAAHNLAAVKSGFNTFSPAPMGTGDPNIPKELREVGIIGFRAEFSDLLRAVLESNSQYGYYMADPIGMAVGMFIGNNPDKLIYTISKNSKQAKTAINYTAETKTWVINNDKLLSVYPDVAFVIAPHTGKYDPNVVKFLEASDIIGPTTNPFDDNSKLLKQYLLDAATVKDRTKYYDIDREVQIKFADPNNLDRNRASYRTDLLNQAKSAKEALLIANPALKLNLGTNPVETQQALWSKFNHLNQMVNNKEFAKVFPSEGQRLLLQQMCSLTDRMLMVLANPDVKSQMNGRETMNKVHDEGLANLRKISTANPALTEAFQVIIEPLISNVYTVPVVAMEKP